ncbi:MAG: hypothetical protein ACKV2Q_05425 [Planctomycetaceae bacterium]
MTSRSATFVLCLVTAVIAWGSEVCLIATKTFGIAEGALMVVGLTAAAGAVCARRRISDVDQELAAERDAIKAERQELSERRAEIGKFVETATVQLTNRARQLDTRELHLANRLVNFREWLEYPQPDDGTIAEAPEASPRELSAQDQRVMEIIGEESQQLYQRLREGHYKPEGKLDGRRIRDDAHAFVIRVAQVYQPGVENPLLETSLDQLLRAGSRACLHLLVVLERLPLSPKDQNINTLHGYLQRALKAYDLYNSAQPYLGYMQTVTYFGRWLAGATPVTLGISWALMELGRRGTKAAANWLIDNQAVALLNEVVRVIGFEVASIYGGDFRHRDPNWVYAAELTDLMSRFPLSRENLAQSLREVGSLHLRSEYDRVFLYRCLSTHHNVRPLAETHDTLTLPERQQIARRLERFFESFIHGKTRKLIDDWRGGVEKRLGLKLHLGDTLPATTHDKGSAEPHGEQLKAATSLAAFLICVKGCPLDDLSTRLNFAELFRKLDEHERRELLEATIADPPYAFVPPDLDVSLPTVTQYVGDLCRLAARARPWDVQPDEIVLETAVFLDQDFAKTKKLLDREFGDAFASLVPKDAPGSNLDVLVAKVALAELATDESLLFAYSGTDIAWPAQIVLPAGERKSGLVGTSTRILLIEASERGFVVATSRFTGLKTEKLAGRLIDDCEVSGNVWSVEGREGTASIRVRISGSMLSRHDSYFRPLIETLHAAVKT